MKHHRRLSIFKRRKPLAGRAGDLKTLKTLVLNFIDVGPLIPDQDFDPGQGAQFSVSVSVSSATQSFTPSGK